MLETDRFKKLLLDRKNQFRTRHEGIAVDDASPSVFVGADQPSMRTAVDKAIV